MYPLNKTKKQHIFLEKKLCIYKQKSNTFFQRKNCVPWIKKKKKKKGQLNSFCLVKKHNFTQYMVKSPKNPRNGCADLRQNHTKQENHNPFMRSLSC